MKWLRRIRCALFFGGHDEELFLRQSDQRYLIWICKRCDCITRTMKTKHKDLKRLRKIAKNSLRNAHR